MSQEQTSQEQTSQEQSARTIKTVDQKPFANAPSVTRAIRSLGLDERDYDIVEQDGGYVGVLKAQVSRQAVKTATTNTDDVRPANDMSSSPYYHMDKNGKWKERYFRVKFQHKSDATQPDDVELGVQGEVLQITRNVPVIIPGRFREAADNAVTVKFRQMPGETRKAIAEVRTFPYDLIGEATEQEFLEMRTSGTRLARQAVENAAY